MLPLTTAMGTHMSSVTKTACCESGRVGSWGSSTMRSFAVRPGDGVSQSKWGCMGWGRASFFIRSKAGWCNLSFRPKALAIDS